jgi:lysine-specific demethylase/histidyl-hydroxylase NO66
VYGEDIDVTLYENGVRHTLNPTPEPRSSNGGGEENGSEEAPGIVAEHQDLWNHFSNGCSLRMLCPQKFDDNIWKLLSGLEDEFNCMVGCNVYLTPAGSQGFAPHYDDIEAFVLQLEGKKHWRIYSPREDEILPRYSSANFSQDEIGKPLIEVTLEPGDLLYFPRGFIHQAVTVGDKASLHLTVSTAQLNSYADLLETCVPQAVASVVEKTIAIRKSLPPDYLEYLGVAASDNDDDHRRKMFKATLRTMLMQVVEECVDMVDATADQVAKKFILQRLPPPIPEEDEAKMDPDTPIRPDSMLRVVRKGVARVMVEEGKVVVYHCMDNARVLYGAEFAPLEFELDDGPAIEMLLNAYPDPVRVNDLPHPPNEDIEDKIGIAESLFKERLLVLVGNSTDNPNLLAKNGGKPAKRSRLSSHGVDSDHDDEDDDDDDYEDDQQDEAEEEEDDDAPW